MSRVLNIGCALIIVGGVLSEFHQDTDGSNSAEHMIGALSGARSCIDRSVAPGTGPEISGLRLGMSWPAVLANLRCSDQEVILSAWEDRSLPTGEANSPARAKWLVATIGNEPPCRYNRQRNAIRCEEPASDWHGVNEIVTTAFLGAEGQETLVAIWRTQFFRPDDVISPAAEVTALTREWGSPLWANGGPAGHSSQWIWARDAGGAVLTPEDITFLECTQPRRTLTVMHLMASDRCGMTIRAAEGPDSEARQSLPSLTVELTNPSELLSVVAPGPHDAITDHVDRDAPGASRLSAGRIETLNLKSHEPHPVSPFSSLPLPRSARQAAMRYETLSYPDDLQWVVLAFRMTGIPPALDEWRRTASVDRHSDSRPTATAVSLQTQHLAKLFASVEDVGKVRARLTSTLDAYDRARGGYRLLAFTTKNHFVFTAAGSTVTLLLENARDAEFVAMAHRTEEHSLSVDILLELTGASGGPGAFTIAGRIVEFSINPTPVISPLQSTHPPGPTSTPNG